MDLYIFVDWGEFLLDSLCPRGGVWNQRNFRPFWIKEHVTLLSVVSKDTNAH